MAKIPLGESYRDEYGRIVRADKVTQPRRARNDENPPPSVEDGPAWGAAGSMSLTSFLAKKEKEASDSDEYVKELALSERQGPLNPSNGETGIQTPPGRSSDLKASGELIRRSAPANALIGQVVERETVNAMPQIIAATQQFFEDLENGEKTAKDHFRKHWLTPEAMRDTEKANAKMLAEHIDFQQYRVFKRGHYHQQMMMLSKTTRTYAMSGRRAGKTEGLVLMAVNEAILPEHRILIIGLTHETTVGLYWHAILKLLDELDLKIDEKKQADGLIRLSNGSLIKLTGNSTSDEREKLRGGKWHLAIIDEAQSQKALPYLVRDIIEPMLLDFKGRLFIAGTGPRVRGTFWETVWEKDLGATRLNWNLTHNPFIPDHETVLAKIRQDKGLSENDALYLREYLGKIAYDDDALVLRFKEANYYTPQDLITWMSSIPRTDLRFIGGLDYGFTDSDGFVILLYAESRPEVFVVYQHKAAREGIEQLKKGITDGLEYILRDPLFQSIPDDYKSDMFIYADSSDSRASADLSIALGVNIYPAWKHDKQAGVDMIQDDCRRGYLKIPQAEDMTPLEDEGMKTVFLRDDSDNLTREIDDDTYHPDIIPAVIYAARSGPWMYRNRT